MSTVGGQGHTAAGSTATTAAPSRGTRLRRQLVKIPRWRGFGILCALIVLLFVIGLYSPSFFSGPSILELVRGAAVTGILACGMMVLLTMQEIDLSVGSTYAMSVVTGAIAIQAGVNPWLAALLAIALGVVLGAANGVLSVVFRLPLILITLGTLSVYRGIVYIITGGSAIASLPSNSMFDVLGSRFAGISPIIVLLVVVSVGAALLYHLTPFGLRVRAIGSNRAAAHFSGLPIGRTVIQATAFVGLLAGLSGAVMLAFFGNADPSVGTGLELQVLAAAILGGTALSGGSGSAVGAVLGAIFLNAINTALIYLGLPSTFSTFVTGLVIVVAVGLDSVIRGGALLQIFRRR